jgi:hypothetical protein
MELEIKECDTWLMHCGTARLTSFTVYLSYLYLYFYIQTLTTLNLSSNEIGCDGIKHLTDAVENNKANFVFS